jgi:hypothetical protein
MVTTEPSDPTTGNRWFATSADRAFPFATTFLGDYSNIAALPTGGIVAYWTGLRNEACFGGRCGTVRTRFSLRHSEPQDTAAVAPSQR